MKCMLYINHSCWTYFTFDHYTELTDIWISAKEDNVELSDAVNLLGVVRMVLSLKIQRTATMLEVTFVKFVLCL